MNCVIVTPHRYGIYEMSRRVGELWEAAGHEVEYVLSEGNAATVGPVTMGAPAISVWWYRKLAEVAARDELPDLIWTHQPITPMLPTTDPEFWRRTVLTVHSTHTREYELARDGIYPRRFQPYYWLVSRLEQRFHTAIREVAGSGPQYTVVSPHLQQELRKIGVAGSTYIPNGVFTPEVTTFEPVRQEYGIPDDATLVFNVGSLTTQKRPGVFAEVMSAAVDRLENTYCVIAGTGGYEAEVQQHQSDRFRHLGYISDEEKWRWFADADMFASLSAYEGMPVASAEALSFGLPLLLSDIPAHRHLLSEYDATGALVDDSVERVVAAIERLRGERTHVDLPTWNEVAERYIDLSVTRSTR